MLQNELHVHCCYKDEETQKHKTFKHAMKSVYNILYWNIAVYPRCIEMAVLHNHLEHINVQVSYFRSCLQTASNVQYKMEFHRE